MKKTDSTVWSSFRLMSAIWNSCSKSEIARSPRITARAPRCLTKCTRSPSKVSTSTRAKSLVASFTISTRLDDCGDAGLRRRVKTVPEGEEGIRRHHAALHLQHRFRAGEPDRVNPAHLPRADPDRLPLSRVHDGVRLHMFAHCPGECAGGVFLVGGASFGRHRKGAKVLEQAQIAILHDKAANQSF